MHREDVRASGVCGCFCGDFWEISGEVGDEWWAERGGCETGGAEDVEGEFGFLSVDYEG